MPNSPGSGIVWKIHRRLPVSHVEAADVALHVRSSRCIAAQRCAAPTITTSFATIGVACSPTSPVIEVDLLIVILLQIDDAVHAEAGDGRPVVASSAHQPVPGRHVENSLLLAVGPVRDAATRQLARRRRSTRTLSFAVDPQQFAGRRIERDDGTARPAVE